MIQGFHHLQKYWDDILNFIQPLMLETVNVLADVRKDTMCLIDVSTAWKAQTKHPKLIFLITHLGSSALLLFSLQAIRYTNASCTAKQSLRKLRNTKWTLLANLVIWKFVSLFIQISKSMQICKIFSSFLPHLNVEKFYLKIALISTNHEKMESSRTWLFHYTSLIKRIPHTNKDYAYYICEIWRNAKMKILLIKASTF